ncbi:MAG: hypothetical protein EBE86_024710 [Hormoscilla sp. GUM202]|nr:hypothetical protein [Hormoscilla sp. GUM202]
MGSGCQWNGRGVEPQWNNPKCSKVYDHILRHHGPQLQPRHFQGRIASTNTDQGQWLNLQDLVKAEQVTPKHPGRYIIDFQRPLGRVYHADGSITENVTRVNIKRKLDGTLKYAYPVVDNYTLKRREHE